MAPAAHYGFGKAGVSRDVFTYSHERDADEECRKTVVVPLNSESRMVGDSSRAFTVSVPEVRKYRFIQRLPKVLLVGSWIVVGYALFGPAERPNWLGMVIAGTFLAFSVGSSSPYVARQEKNLVAAINSRFAEVFTAKTGFEYPPDIDILEVKRTIAVRKDDGSVVLWGVQKEKNGLSVSLAS